MWTKVAQNNAPATYKYQVFTKGAHWIRIYGSAFKNSIQNMHRYRMNWGTPSCVLLKKKNTGIIVRRWNSKNTTFKPYRFILIYFFYIFSIIKFIDHSTWVILLQVIWDYSDFKVQISSLLPCLEPQKSFKPLRCIEY